MLASGGTSISVGVPAMPKCQHEVTRAGLFAPVPSPNATIVVIDMPVCTHCVLTRRLLAQARLFTYLLTLMPHLFIPVSSPSATTW